MACNTFVDFAHSLNTAVMKLREALGDTAEKPLYIEKRQNADIDLSLQFLRRRIPKTTTCVPKLILLRRRRAKRMKGHKLPARLYKSQFGAHGYSKSPARS